MKYAVKIKGAVTVPYACVGCWPLSHCDGNFSVASYSTTNDHAIAEAVAKARGGKVFHVTRYRLAPLVRMWWTAAPGMRLVACNDFGDVALATIDGCDWWVHSDRWLTGDFKVFRTKNVAEAKAACAARLRELGYLVVGNG